MKPRNLKECFEALDIILSSEDKKLIQEFESEKDMTANCHFGLGRWIRNNWELWSEGQLSRYFKDLGIEHPDDMSGIILTSYWREKHNLPILLDKQIKYYQDYWKDKDYEKHK